MGRKNGKSYRELEARASSREVTGYDDLLPYRMAIRQQEERRMAKIMEEQQKERERTELAVAKREKELLWDFCICAVLLVIMTACVTAIVLPVM